MNTTQRLFIGIDLPSELKERVSGIIGKAKGEARKRGIHWVAPAKLHLTLKFLGETESTRIPAIFDAMAEVARAHPRETGPLEICSAGVFPDARHPRVLWLDVRDPGAWLAPLAASLEQVLASLGFERERRPFVTHLTVARLEHRLPGRLLERLMQSRVGEFQPMELILFESRPAPFHDYLPLGSVPLRTSQTVSRPSR